MRWPKVLRPYVAPALAFVGSVASAWFAKKGLNVSDTTITGILVGGTSLGSKLIAAATNPNDAAAPSMVRSGPLEPPLSEIEVPDPLPVTDEWASPYAPKPNAPNPIIAANAAKMAAINAAATCVYCALDGGQHKDWCKVKGGSGVAPTGEFDDTRTFKRGVMQKIADQMDAAIASAMQAREPAPVEKSKILRPKPEPTPAAKPRTAKDRRASQRRGRVQTPGAPPPATGSGYEP